MSMKVGNRKMTPSQMKKVALIVYLALIVGKSKEDIVHNLANYLKVDPLDVYEICRRQVKLK